MFFPMYRIDTALILFKWAMNNSIPLDSLDHIKPATLWLFNIAMENGPFIDGLPIKNGDFPWLCYISRWYI